MNYKKWALYKGTEIQHSVTEAHACSRDKPMLETPQTTGDWKEDQGAFNHYNFLILYVLSSPL